MTQASHFIGGSFRKTVHVHETDEDEKDITVECSSSVTRHGHTDIMISRHLHDLVDSLLLTQLTIFDLHLYVYDDIMYSLTDSLSQGVELQYVECDVEDGFIAHMII